MHQDKAENSDDQGIDQFSDNKAGKRLFNKLKFSHNDIGRFQRKNGIDKLLPLGIP